MVRNQRKRMSIVAKQLRSGTNLDQKQRAWIAKRFEDIGEGADANDVFGLTYDAGQSEVDEKRRENLRLIFSWILAAITLDTTIPVNQRKNCKPVLKIGEALKEASELSKERGGLFKPIELSTLRAAWYNKKYDYLKSLVIRPLDPDSPF